MSDFFNFVNRLFGSNTASSFSSKKAKRQRGRTCRIEELESRDMLSVTPFGFDEWNSFSIPLQNEPVYEINQIVPTFGMIQATNASYDDADVRRLVQLGLDPYDTSICKWDIVSGRLIGLDVSGRDLTGTLNLTQFTALQELNCSDNQLTGLNITACTLLKRLDCSNNKLTGGLNVSFNTELTFLDCSKNTLISLNLSGGQNGGPGCINLITLDCSDNQLMALGRVNLEKLTSLVSLNCSNNNLTSLHVADCTALEKLDCSGNELTTLNVSNLTNLTHLNCSGNDLTALNVSNLANLLELRCSENALTALDVSSGTVLQILDCSGNNLTALNVSNLTQLYYLDCKDNNIEELNLSGCDVLHILDCSGNNLTALNVSNLTQLLFLECKNNNIEELNLSGCVALLMLNCSSNALTELDVSSFTSLTDLDCSGNELESLDVSKHTGLVYLHCQGNRLKFSTLDLPDGFPYLPNHYGFTDQKGTVDIRLLMTPLEKLDLSGENKYEATIYTWYYDGGTEKVEDKHISNHDGIFSFTGLAGQTIYCVMTNARYPGMELTTNSMAIVSIKLAKPTVTVGEVTDTTIEISWDVVPNASGYQIRWVDQTGNEDSKVVTGTSFKIENLLGNTVYQMTVQALGDGVDFEDSDRSDVLTVMTLPSSPQNLKSTGQTASSITVEWDVPTGGAAGYEVRYQASGESWWRELEAQYITGTEATISGLLPNWEYTIEVRALNGDGNSSEPSDISRYTLSHPPQNLKSTGQTATSITVEWDEPGGGAAGYEVRYQASGEPWWIELEAQYITGTAATISGLLPNWEYTIEVRALNGDRNSSEPSDISRYTLPNTPTGLMSTSQTASSITVEWDVPTGGAAGYEVRYQASGESWWIELEAQYITGTAATISGLLPNWEYTIEVRALNGNGNSSEPSNISRYTLSHPPQNLNSTSQTATSITVEWDEPGGGAAGYEVRYQASGEPWWIELEAQYITGTAATISGLLPNWEYTIEVRALNGDRNSSEPSDISRYTLSHPPQNLNSTAQTATSITLTWEEPDGGAAGYEIRYLESGGTWSGWSGTHVTGTEAMITGLSPNQKYEFEVRSLNDEEKPSIPSKMFAGYTLPNTPTGLMSTSQTASSITVEWDVPTGGAAGYEIRYLESGGTWSGWSSTYVTGTAATISGLLPNWEYTIEVRALNGDGNSSEPSDISRYTLSHPPQNLKSTGQTATSITVEWDAPDDRVTDYVVRYQVSGESWWTELEAQYITGTAATISGLLPNWEYTIEVRALNGDENSSEPSDISRYTLSHPPQNLKSTGQTATSITLTWEAPDDRVTDYVVRYQASGESWWTELEAQYITGTEATISGLLPNWEYTIEVRALNGDENSSEPSDISRYTLSHPPQNLKSTGQTATSITLTWEAPDDRVTDYVVRYQASGESWWIELEAQYITGTAATISGLLPNWEYTIEVRALNGDGNSSEPSDISRYTLSHPPQNLRSTAQTATSITLTWEAPKDQNLDGITYTLQYKESDANGDPIGEWKTAETGITGLAYTHKELVPGALYYYQVIAVNRAGESEPSALYSIKTYKFDAPMNLRATQAGQTSLALQWNAVAGAPEYVLERSTDGTTFEEVAQVMEAKFVDDNDGDGLESGVTYYYRVKVYDSDPAATTFSDGVPITTDNKRTDVPIIKHTDHDDAKITWVDLGNQYTYTVYRNGYIIATNVSGNFYTDDNPLPNAQAQYAVRAFNTETQRSSTVSISVVNHSVSSTIEITGYEYTPEGIKLTWIAQPDMTALSPSYEIQQRGNSAVHWDLGNNEFMVAVPQTEMDNYLFVLVATYTDTTGTKHVIQSNIFSVPKPKI